MFDKDRVKEKISNFVNQPISNLEDGILLTDLVAESFVMIEMMIELQEEFGVRFFVQEDFRDVKTVGDLIVLLENHAYR